MESLADRARAFALAVGLHALLIALIWLSAFWILPRRDTTAVGESIQASLQVSAADIRQAKAAIKAAAKPIAPEPVAVSPPPQPLPEPKPETSDQAQQVVPQAPQEKPDTVDQQRVTRMAPEPSDQKAPQEERVQQEQVDMTVEMIRRRIAERRQRLHAQLEAIKLERADAAKNTRMEEQRLQQLADARASAPTPAARAPSQPPAGNHGSDDDLLARYKAAMAQNADANWKHAGVPELRHCHVSFTQIPGGEVINVEFIDCPYDAEGRDSVDRALHKTPMPYSGFEKVFIRKATLDFCYPKEECER